MRCNHCGAPDGTDQRVNFESKRLCKLTLCEECVRDFQQDNSVVAVTPAIARGV
ncbi:hypothetical protein HWV07_17635 [Natronomonas salina]|uniref:hypothetical protein n=1 Tax=Natronomonas salina TaxID=1710540 RepID=UPI0015B56A81|nr:hypothetical protein [Natronomonas salina]QLD90767.1 hypothetical protein HWV07_17635 [Natronomonas salina]